MANVNASGKNSRSCGPTYQEDFYYEALLHRTQATEFNFRIIARPNFQAAQAYPSTVSFDSDIRGSRGSAFVITNFVPIFELYHAALCLSILKQAEISDFC